MTLPQPPNTPLAHFAHSQPQSELARDFDLTNLQVAQIEEAFKLLAVQVPDPDPDEEWGLLELCDVRRCLLALGLPFQHSILRLLISEPGQRYVTYKSFASLVAILIHKRSRDRRSQPDRNSIDPKIGLGTNSNSTVHPSRQSPSQARSHLTPPSAQAAEAFRLFAKSRGQVQSHITLSTLRRVVRELREEVDDEWLKQMILYANNEEYVSDESWMKGANFEEFCAVMERTGAFK